MVQEALCDILQSVFEEAFGSSAMIQNLYLLDVFVNIDTNDDVRVAELPVCPVKRQRIRSFYRYEL